MNCNPRSVGTECERYRDCSRMHFEELGFKTSKESREDCNLLRFLLFILFITK